MTESVWENYYDRKENQRLAPDEDVARFLGQLPYDRREDLRVLDFGSGDCRNGWIIRRFFPYADLVGCDLFFDAFKKSMNRGFYSEFTDHPPIIRHNPFSIVIDCMTSQHFPWAEHPAHFQRMYDCLKPGGWYFLKHLNDFCSDVLEQDEVSRFTWDNIRESPSACYPNNGVVCMPHHDWLTELLARTFSVKRNYTLQRAEYMLNGEELRRFAHSIIFCQKPA